MGFVITVHVIACILLIVLILIQSGRGGGLVEGFSGVESMFGPKTNVFLTRMTTVLGITFFLTCIALAFLSTQQSKSLMSRAKPQKIETQSQAPQTTSQPSPASETAKTE